MKNPKLRRTIILLLILTLSIGMGVFFYRKGAKESVSDVQREPTQVPAESAASAKDWPEPDGVANIIFDTDMTTDVDDVGALAVLHALSQQGKANILAVMGSTSCQYTAPCLDALNTYFGQPDIPVGTMKTKDNIDVTGTRYNREIAQTYENDTYNGFFTRDAVDVYRDVLSKAEDNSVTIVVVGSMNNLVDLLKSQPDAYSEWNGVELVARKVKLTSIMAGRFPSGTEHNVKLDPAAAQYVVQNWPAPIMFSGGEIGSQIKTGGTRDQMPADSPVRRSYDLYLGGTATSKTRASWDLTSVLYAVEGLGDYWTMVRGTMQIADDGSNTFVESADGNHAFLVEKMSADEMTAILDDLMVSAKKDNPDEPTASIVDAAPGVSGVILKDMFLNDISKARLAYNRTMYYGNTAGCSVSITFTGAGIDVFGGCNADHSKVKIYIDGDLVDTVDTYSPNNIASMLIYSNRTLEYGKHTLTLENSGEKCGESKGMRMDCDCFKIYSDRNSGAKAN